MFELSGTQFAKGVFELRLEKVAPRPFRGLLQLGAIRGRLVALIFFVAAGFLTYLRQPSLLIVNHRWASVATAIRIQDATTWTLMGIGLVIYVFVFVFRLEKMTLEFDRHDNELRYIHEPLNAKTRVREGRVPFSQIENIEVFAPNRSQKTPYGFLEVRLKDRPKPYNRIRFRILSEEQFKIYPLNLSKIVGKSPIGDWKDPDDAILQSGSDPART